MCGRGERYDVVVVGGGAAGAAACRALSGAERRVLLLEASGRLGGRVHSAPLGDGFVELGAEWIHGEVGSEVFSLAQATVAPVQQDIVFTALRSDGAGSEQLSALVNELVQVGFSETREPAPGAYDTLGDHIANRVKAYIKEHHPSLHEDAEFVGECLHFLQLLVNNYEGSNEWTDVSAQAEYRELEGHQHWSWHRHGYHTLFDVLMNTYKGGPGLANVRVQCHSEVRNVAWEEPGGVRVTCADGRQYWADAAVVAVSLGVLQERHATLFTPALPRDKIDAINTIPMGLIDKIVLSFSHVWWPTHTSFFAFVWKREDRLRVSDTEQHWSTRVFGASVPRGAAACLTLWTSGEVAKQVEAMPEELVTRHLVQLLQRFIGDHVRVQVPPPTGFMRSLWHSDPLTRGSYSYSGAGRGCAAARRALRGAVRGAGGAARVLLCGEHVHAHHYSTVHGALQTGQHAARVLLAERARSKTNEDLARCKL